MGDVVIDMSFEQMDRAVAEAVQSSWSAERAWRARLPPSDWPNLERHRAIARKSLYDDMPSGDPLLDSLRGWVHHLTILRVTWHDRARWELSRRLPLQLPEEAPGASVQERIDAILAEPHTGRRRSLVSELARIEGRALDPAFILLERDREARRLIGPAPGEAGDGSASPSGSELAPDLLRATDAFVGPAADLAEAFDRQLATSAGQGWPANLRVRWLTALFRGTELFDGTRTRLADDELRAPLGGASFARALGQLGVAWARGATEATQPFCLQHSPDQRRPWLFGWLFAILLTDPLVHRRALGVGEGAARDQARQIAVALTTDARIDAAQLDVGAAQASSVAELRERLSHAAERALSTGIPTSLAGHLPKLRLDARARLDGLLRAAHLRLQLRDEFDEDWFRNPRCAEYLRAEMARPVDELAIPEPSVSAWSSWAEDPGRA